jgi:hypothetical protein
MPDDPKTTPPKTSEDLTPRPPLRLSTDLGGFDLTPQNGQATKKEITLTPHTSPQQEYGPIGKIAALGFKPLAPPGRPKHHVLRTPGHLVHKTPKPINSPRLGSQVEASTNPSK